MNCACEIVTIDIACHISVSICYAHTHHRIYIMHTCKLILHRYVCIYTYMYLELNIRRYMYMYMYIQVHIHAYTCTRTCKLYTCIYL